jgi:phosphomannomutase/phosphoglucomutase
LEIIAIREQNLDAIMAGLPECYCTPEIKIPVPEDDKHQIIKEILLESSQLADVRVIAIDGLRLEYAEGWGLVRASNTSAALTLRFEADTQAALDAIIERFKSLLRAVAPELALDF